LNLTGKDGITLGRGLLDRVASDSGETNTLTYDLNCFYPFTGEAVMRTSAVRSEIREVMDIRQASAYLGISPDSLYKYASEGFIPAFKLGNRWRFKKSRIDEWMDQQSSASLMPVQPMAVSGREKKPVRAAR
jgi:excisionase family DNA binding protein